LLPFLTCAEYYHPANFTCFALGDIRYHVYRQREFPLARHIPSQHSTYPIAFSSSALSIIPHFFPSPVLSIKHNVFNGTIYIFNCDWIRQKLVIGGTIPESTRPSRIHARTPIVFLQTLHPCALRLHFPPSLASEHPQNNPQDPLRSSRVAHP
jgi:hypothetical protein